MGKNSQLIGLTFIGKIEHGHLLLYAVKRTEFQFNLWLKRLTNVSKN